MPSWTENEERQYEHIKDGFELEARTKDGLENRARELRIRGRSKMRKDELIEAIRDAES